MRVIATTQRYLRIHHKTAKVRQDQLALNRLDGRAERWSIPKSQAPIRVQMDAGHLGHKSDRDPA
jgi:hypothetical protein